MAYRFDGVDDCVEFAIAPLVGLDVEAAGLTIACFFNRTTLSTNDFLVSFTQSDGGADLMTFYASNTDVMRFFRGTNSSGPSVGSSSIWYLAAVTYGGVQPRFHLHDGTSWTHTNAGTTSGSYTVGGTNRVAFGAKPNSANPFVGDAVCFGVKRSDSSDAAIQTLSRTAFSAWTAFGFHLLIGFDASLEAAGVLQDQSAAGTGDEIAITGTSAVADPAGWSWGGGGGGAAAFVPRIAIVG